MSILVESITNIELFAQQRPLFIRVWRMEDDFVNRDNSDLYARAQRHRKLPVEKLAHKLLLLDRVNAVEVLNEYKEGIVVYKDWP